MELDGEHRAVEGVGDYISGVPEQVQELRRTGVQNLPGLGVDLLPDAAQLHHRQARLPAEPVDIGRQRPGAADAVAEDIPAGGIVCRMVGHGGPLLRRQQQRGVQHHRHVPARRVPDDLPALGLPDGDVGKAVQIALQLRPHPLGDHGDAEGGSVGDAALFRKGAEKHRVEPAVRENFRIPDLVAAGEDQVIGQLRGGQLVKAPIAVRRNVEMVPAELLKPPVALREGLVMQGGVDIVGGGAQASGPLEESVVLVDKVVHDLAVPAEMLHGPLRGRRLKQGPVMVNMIKGDKSRFQRSNFLSQFFT